MSSRKFTLGKEERLKSRKLIEALFREGKSFSLFPFRVYYMQGAGLGTAGAEGGAAGVNVAGGVDVGEKTSAVGGGGRLTAGQPILQAGFVAGSRNFKKAVDRNRIKRLSREAYRLQKNFLQDHLAAKGRRLALFFIYTGKELPDYDTLTKKIGLVLQKLVKETGG